MGGIHYQPKSYKDYKYLYTFYSRSFRTVSLLFKNRPSKCLKFYLKNFYSSNSLSRLGLPLVVENASLGFLTLKKNTFGAFFKVDNELNVILRRKIAVWLLCTASLVAGAVTIGGITRLTESGLSMVNWHPVYGIRPPFSEKEWEEEFNEYKNVHQHLTLNDFKKIFIWEYLHRIWGRAIGIAFVVPAVYYCCKGYLNFQLKLFSLGISSLIGFQGFLGWYMVKSGLQDPNLSEFPYCVPRVSQYRLAAHLGSAFIIYGLLLHKGLQLLLPSLNLANKTISKFQFYSKLAMGLVFITALSGAFVAGLDAGLLYNTFPKMADQWIPAELLAFKPTWRNFFENPTTVQFSHRILGLSTFFYLSFLWLATRRVGLPPRAKFLASLLFFIGGVQISLGISTLLLHVPISLATAHQGGSLALLTTATWLAREFAKYSPK